MFMFFRVAVVLVVLVVAVLVVLAALVVAVLDWAAHKEIGRHREKWVARENDWSPRRPSS